MGFRIKSGMTVHWVFTDTHLRHPELDSGSHGKPGKCTIPVEIEGIPDRVRNDGSSPSLDLYIDIGALIAIGMKWISEIDGDLFCAVVVCAGGIGNVFALASGAGTGACT